MKKHGKVNGHRRDVKKDVKKRPKKKSVNVSELSRQVGLSRERLYEIKKEGCPLDEGAEAVKAWHAKHYPPKESSANFERIQKAKAERFELQVEAERLAQLIKKGESMPRHEAELWAIELTTMVRNRLQSIPEQAVSELPIELRPQFLEIWQNLINLILTEMSQSKLGQ